MRRLLSAVVSIDQFETADSRGKVTVSMVTSSANFDLFTLALG